MNFFGNRWIQLSALTTFLAFIGINALRLKYCVIDYDLWWHLKVGDWIVRHLAVPHTGILSRTVAARPWVAYSWGYEVLLSKAYGWFGLAGVGILGTLLTVGVAYCAYWMVRRISGRFWLALVLAGLACSAFLFNGMPRPVFFSMMLYSVTLGIVFQAQQSGRVELLYWLPPIMTLWANLHIQFIYGLFAVGLFVGVNVAQDLLTSAGFAPAFLRLRAFPARPMLAILGLCAVATVIGPNFYHPYLAALAYAKSKYSYKIIMELQPLSFRDVGNFTELFLGAAGFYAVGWRKQIDPFRLLLLVVASAVAFRTMRDAWFLVFSASACLADFPAREENRSHENSWSELALCSGALALLLMFAAPLLHFDARGIDRAISADYPVNAINYLRREGFSGPLYNNLNWGGFLMWYLPELPVAVDGRNDLYGDDLDQVFYESQSAYPSYASDPYLADSRLVILDSKLPLAKALATDGRFALAYRDDIATVFVRR
ncbi:MAG TPA: hypothetical protein VL128_03220 [Candidatus Eisenbacteria bacterium]|nr:hypothetical protein [Candidatus Eisenbacteria bacterium]